MVTSRLDNLLTWGKQNGVKWPREVDFVENTDRGVAGVANKEISSATFEVPSDLIIRGALAKCFFNVDSNLNTWLKLLVAKLKFDPSPTVVESQNLNEKFGPYIDALPREVDSPLVWNPAELLELGNSNLRSSLPMKLKSIFHEWRGAVEQLQNQLNTGERVQEEFDSIQQLVAEGDEEHIYQEITSKVFDDELNLPWTSFPAFLWSHLVFLSRAFPEHILTPEVDPSSVILLPIVDLLNHSYNSKVEWSNAHNSFSVTKLERTREGQEIFNNYGGKGNEELLVGYGFVLEENIFDTAALKIKLPLAAILRLQTETSIKLPTMLDYTTSAFEVSSGRKIPSGNENELSQYEDGLLYLLSTSNSTCLEWLLDLFAWLGKNLAESHLSLRTRLQGLQNLRAAIEDKYGSLKAVSSRPLTVYTAKDYRVRSARIYKSGQLRILKDAINELKRTEKRWTAHHKQHTLTVSKILRDDPNFFEEELPRILQSNTDDEIELDSYHDLLFMWVTCKVQYQSIPKDIQWVTSQYDKFLQTHANEPDLISEDVKKVHAKVFFNDPNKLMLRPLAAAVAFVEASSYTRLSNDEMILVQDTDL
ncbi:LADA_0H10286g1_1 [Lachancea dasiensis]|uniref:LADA_0H10286g1_1 n=1 Tax=Lachancea dasiensis TaxID=1072105 RepID=A0A1G4K321_9SACH|nr:LADA_0H10286g1_1 [Lachancea dasiensis]